MTKEEWKNKFIDLLISEPEVGKGRYLDKDELKGYLDQLESMSDSYYGIGWEIMVSIEIHLGV